MDINKIESLQKKYYEAESNARIGLYIILVGVVAVIVNIFGWMYDSQIMQGIILGGGFVFWGVSFDKKHKTRKELDNICFSIYGKDYKNSVMDILNDRLKANQLKNNSLS